MGSNRMETVQFNVTRYTLRAHTHLTLFFFSRLLASTPLLFFFFIFCFFFICCYFDKRINACDFFYKVVWLHEHWSYYRFSTKLFIFQTIFSNPYIMAHTHTHSHIHICIQMYLYENNRLVWLDAKAHTQYILYTYISIRWLKQNGREIRARCDDDRDTIIGAKSI